MIEQTTNPAAPSTTPPAELTFNTFAGEITDFFRGLLALDPQQALLRAGLTLLVLIGASLLVWGLRVIFKALTERIGGAETPEQKRRRIGRWTVRVARISIYITAVVVILRLWGLDLATLRDSPIYAIFSALGRIAIILVLTLAASELGQLAITKLFDRIARRAKSARRAAQVRTLAPLLSGVATTVLVIMAAMMSLSEIGVEIGPLIAGAGIVGLAVGFGAQTLVKDFLTGIFLLVEDIVSVGDIVRIGEFGGVVEEMSLRTIKLRDFDGTLHVFPYSEAQVLHNMTKSFSYYVFDLSISYSSDIATALDVMKKTGDEMKADKVFGPLMLEAIEIVGVDQLAESGVKLKARVKTLPSKQWTVGREYLRRIKLAFDAAEVEIPSHVKLVAPSGPG